MSISFSQREIKQGWWNTPCSKEDSIFIARFIVKNSENNDMIYEWHWNPTDSRGGRSIVSYCCTVPSENNRKYAEKDMNKFINCKPTFEENVNLHLIIGLCSSICSELPVFVQTAVAGNNSHSLQNKVMIIGEPEVSVQHGHLIWRGNPKQTVGSSNFTIGGPSPGEMFNMRGNGTEPGNDSKRSWCSGQMKDLTKMIHDIMKKHQNLFTKYVDQVLF
mmetsp:Transcript_10603/g.15528  ORF Transcript_10603/g.15528 Transcript_10603/m.15528 type:complete len:218 (-) Transcript_10603:2354-3007(-)